MSLFLKSITFISFFILSGCNQTLLGTVKNNTTDANEIASKEYQLPALLPHWAVTATEQAEHHADTFVETDPFAIDYDDYISDGFDIIWDRIRAGFTLPTSEHKKVQSELRWFARHKDYLDRVVDRAEPFLHFIMEELDKRDMPAELALLPIVESAFQPFAYSHGQAAGIWQFIPSTGRIYGLKQNWWYDGRRDIHASTIAALDYLQYLAKAFDGNWLHALAAYNSGIGTVGKAIKRNRRQGKPTDFWNLKLPKETQGYVPKLMALTKLISEPELYDVDLKCIQNAPYFKVINTGSQIDLAVAAELADLDIEDLYKLNPGFNRWATDPAGPHRLLIPIENSEQFEAELQTIQEKNRITWKRYKIRTEDTLSHIANKFHITVSQLKQINKMRSNSIRAGRYLIVPSASKGMAHYALSKSQRDKQRRAIKRSGKGNKIYHTVKSGDSLWDLSQLYKVGTQQIARWNGMSPKDVLKAGQKLVIWTKSLVAPRINSSMVGDFIRTVRYRVRNGDSLYLIAKRFNVSISDLNRWNPVQTKYLKPGQSIKVYVDITKQASNI
ncbi:MAG: LysM peptidoglycan-binding domain-containing protein [Gammaproteobacteria bacterium]|nr:LysM peptidoglycan-binding domain-containing protein [Gammaproteobacteria bacterium]